MITAKADIIARLRRDILPLQGYKKTPNSAVDFGLGSISNAFPNSEFPLGAIHELIADCPENATATSGFIAGLTASLMNNNGTAIWISSVRKIFPPALKLFGIAPEKIIFIDLQKEKEILWTLEEALKCESIASVIGEISELSFTTSRRLQLAVEQSKVTGFILRNNPKSINTTASIARWKITPLLSEPKRNMPGVGFPRWNVELLKVRNGTPGNWEIEFVNGRFRPISQMSLVVRNHQRKTG